LSLCCWRLAWRLRPRGHSQAPGPGRGGDAFGLLGWVLYDLLDLGSAELAVAAAGLAGVVVIIASSVPMWNQILRYARGR